MTDARAAGKQKGILPLPIPNSKGFYKAQPATPSSKGEEAKEPTLFETRLSASSPLSCLAYLTKTVGAGSKLIALMYWAAIKKQVKRK